MDNGKGLFVIILWFPFVLNLKRKSEDENIYDLGRESGGYNHGK